MNLPGLALLTLASNARTVCVRACDIYKYITCKVAAANSWFNHNHT